MKNIISLMSSVVFLSLSLSANSIAEEVKKFSTPQVDLYANNNSFVRLAKQEKSDVLSILSSQKTQKLIFQNLTKKHSEIIFTPRSDDNSILEGFSTKSGQSADGKTKIEIICDAKDCSFWVQSETDRYSILFEKSSGRGIISSVQDVQDFGDDGISMAPSDYAPGSISSESSSSTQRFGDGGPGESLDILMVYTTAARERVLNIHHVIVHSIVKFNQTLNDSNIQAWARVVETMEVENTGFENVDSSLSLQRLKEYDGVHDEIHTARNASGADLVSLAIANMNPSGSTGRGYVWTSNMSTSSFANFAFSVVQVNSLNLILSHEFGHNLGCVHDPAHTSNTGYFSNSHGRNLRLDFCNATPACDASYRTMMAYPPGQVLSNFSTPNIFEAGHPIGTSGQKACAWTIANRIPEARTFRSQVPYTGSGQAPQNVTASDHRYENIRVNWDPVADADFYIVYRREYAAPSCSVEDLVSLPVGTSYTDSNEPFNSDIFYRVRAVKDSILSECSEPARGYNYSGSQSITNFEATDGSDPAGRVFLTWDGYHGSEYFFYRGLTREEVQNCDASKRYTSIVGHGFENRVDMSTQLGVTYHYAIKIGGDTCVYGDSGYAALGSPLSLNSSLNSGNVHLSWEPVPHATHYRVYRSTPEISGCNANYSNVYLTDQNSFQDIDIPSQRPIFGYSVKGMISGQESSFCSPVKVVVTDDDTASPPHSLLASQGGLLNRINFLWHKGNCPSSTPDCADGYYVYRSRNNEACQGAPLAVIDDESRTFYFDTSVGSGNYFYSVRHRRNGAPYGDCSGTARGFALSSIEAQ